MQAGVHVLCEKPFAITLDQVDEMIAASQQTGRVLAEAFMYRHHPQTKMAGEWARSGRLGEVSLVRGAFNYTAGAGDEIYLKADYGGGCLWDVGCYPVSYAQYIYGERPDSVVGMQWVGETGVDETFAGQMQYSQGQLAQITASFRTPYYTHLEILGTLGGLSIERPFVELSGGHGLYFFPKNGEPIEIRVAEADPYQAEVEDMHAAILDGARPYLSLQETREHIRTILRLYESARTADLPDESL